MGYRDDIVLFLSGNPVSELSNTLDAPAPVQLKEMYKVIRHVLSTKGYGLKFELTSDRTKHIDIRTSFVKEYQEDGKIVIKFVKSKENEADIFTKNTTNVIFSNHQKKLVWDNTNVDNEVNQEPNQSKNQQEGC